MSVHPGFIINYNSPAMRNHSVEKGSEDHVFKYILLKLSSRCNINCKYCYWFRDESVYEKPKLLTIEAENAFLSKLSNHAAKFKIDKFSILFHGGEPMLFGKKRFDAFCHKLYDVATAWSFQLKLAMTTNGLLIDEEWIELFRLHAVSITVSIDGPQPIHDTNRVDLKEAGTFTRVMEKIAMLKKQQYDFGLLTVCNPDTNPEQIIRFFVEEVQWPYFDILVPDANHTNKVKSISQYYIRLFDLWYDKYAAMNINIRLFESMCKGLLGLPSNSESIGTGRNTTFTLLTDGSLEPLDVLRIAGNGFTKSVYSVFANELQDIQQDPLWLEVRDACYNLHTDCENCTYKFACGGGHVAHRWSPATRYKNPSVYCSDYKEIFAHIWKKMKKDLYYETIDGKRIAFTQEPIGELS